MFEVGKEYKRPGVNDTARVLLVHENGVCLVWTKHPRLFTLHQSDCKDDRWTEYKEPVVIVQECFINARADGRPEGTALFWTSPNGGKGNHYKTLGKVRITYTEGAGFALENLRMDDVTI